MTANVSHGIDDQHRQPAGHADGRGQRFQHEQDGNDATQGYDSVKLEVQKPEVRSNELTPEYL